MSEKEYIFTIDDRTGYFYFGIFTAELTSDTVGEMIGCKFSSPDVVELWGIVWQDENNKYLKGRFKFPSGNKSTISKSFPYDTEMQEIIASLMVMPLNDFQFYPCVSGSAHEMLKIMQTQDLILSQERRE